MPRTLRVLNVVAALFPLASALAVLVSHVVDPAYGAHYHDVLPLVVAYVAFYVAVAWAFARGSPAAPWLAIAKTLGAYVFLGVCAVLPWVAMGAGADTKGLAGYVYLSAFAALTRQWIAVTPGRYVYELFDWGPDAAVGFFAFVFLGRGAWNTVNAFAATRDHWMALRRRAPLLGRLATAVPVALTVLPVWGFFVVSRLHAKSSSPEANEIARTVFEALDCDTVRAKAGTTTTDVRQRGDRRYDVTILHGCALTVVLVRTEADAYGTAAGPRTECCAS